MSAQDLEKQRLRFMECFTQCQLRELVRLWEQVEPLISCANSREGNKL